MTIARKYQISLESTPYYHIMTRCVRRAFLCGKDKYTANCYEHRRKMIVERIEFLASSFNIDVCAYAIMSNHYHLVLKINSTKNWSEKFFWKEFSRKPSWMKVKLRDELNKNKCCLIGHPYVNCHQFVKGIYKETVLQLLNLI